MADPLDLTHLTIHDVVPEHRAPDTPAANSNFVSNLASSASKFGSNIAGAISHPIDTAKSINDVAVGYLNKLRPSGADPNDGERQTQMADAMTKHFKDRYGGLDNIKKTAYEDPVGFAADLSTVLAPFSGAAKIGGEVAEVAGLAKTAAALKIAGKAGELTNPLALPSNVLKAGGQAAKVAGAGADTINAIEHPVQAGAIGLAKKLYSASLKPVGATARDTGRLAETGLSEGVGPANETRLWKKVMGYGDKAKTDINNAAAQGATADPDRVVGDVTDKLLPSAAGGGEPGVSFGVQAAPTPDRLAVARTLEDFQNQHFTPGQPANPGTVVAGQNTPNPTIVGATPAVPPSPIPIPLDQAQAIKQGTYRVLSKKAFGKSAAGATEPVPVASEQAQLEIARSLRNQISDAVPGIKDINQAEGNLLDLQPHIERNAAAAAKANPLSPSQAYLSHLQPWAAMALYKAGKLDLASLQQILRQGATGAAVNQDANTQ